MAASSSVSLRPRQMKVFAHPCLELGPRLGRVWIGGDCSGLLHVRPDVGSAVSVRVSAVPIACRSTSTNDVISLHVSIRLPSVP